MNIKKYLKNVLELESLSLEQKIELEAIKKMSEVDIDETISKIPVPTKKQFAETAVQDTKSIYLTKGIGYLLLSIFILFCLIGVIVLSVITKARGFEMFMVIVGLLIFAGLDGYFFVSAFSLFSGYKHDETYEVKINRYNSYKQECLSLYENQYEEDVKKYEIQVNNVKNNLVQAKNLLQIKYEQLQEIHNQTKDALEKLYDFNIIYPKYRNIIAVSSINEYFDSGRCDSFTGPNGAYNMYEDEIKQNLIISSLESIRNDLESIKNNQFALYEIMSNNLKYYSAINNEISNVGYKMIELSNTTKRLEEMQTINSGALAFIAMQQINN